MTVKELLALITDIAKKPHHADAEVHISCLDYPAKPLEIVELNGEPNTLYGNKAPYVVLR